MQIRCPHCASTVEVDPETVAGDAEPTAGDAAGPTAASPPGLHGGRLSCANCSDAFSVYVF